MVLASKTWRVDDLASSTTGMDRPELETLGPNIGLNGA
jgi:hypothetical protein